MNKFYKQLLIIIGLILVIGTNIAVVYGKQQTVTQRYTNYIDINNNDLIINYYDYPITSKDLKSVKVCYRLYIHGNVDKLLNVDIKLVNRIVYTVMTDNINKKYSSDFLGIQKVDGVDYTEIDDTMNDALSNLGGYKIKFVFYGGSNGCVNLKNNLKL